MPKLLTDEQRDFAVQIAISGTDPRPFLISCGSNAPDKLWSYIKTSIRGKDPETYRKLPATLKGLRPPEDADPVKYIKLTGPTQIQTPEGNKLMDVDIPEAPKQRNHTLLKNSNFTVSAIRTELGEFYYDKKFDRLDWRTMEGEEVSMSPSIWFRLYEMIPEVMGILEVETDHD